VFLTEQDWLAERFEMHRRHLRGVAYQMLGSLSEADDAVQEAWIRLSRTDTGEVENLRAWLTTVVGRVCLNMLRSRRSRREAPLEARVADPILSPEAGGDPEFEAILGDSIGLALLAVLETLSPPERVAFVLHDVFAVPSERTITSGSSTANSNGQPFSVVSLTVAGGRIVSIDILADPDRLTRLNLDPLGD